MKKKKILEFIESKHLAVLSTINKNNQPESAVVAFAQTKNLEIIFGTSHTTRKFQNLKINKKVSLVIGWDNKENITVQYEGLAREVKDQEFEVCREIQINKNQESKKYAFAPDQTYFKITPVWIRYSDINKENIFEIEFIDKQ